MKILAIETATAWQSVAIVEDDRVLATREQEAGGAHGTLLLPAIDLLLAQSGLKLQDLNGIACSIGPGSFTGLRVGLSTCLGLRAATGLPLVLVPTLEAMARNVGRTSLAICPVLPSRRGEVYWAIFRGMPDGRLNRVLGEQVGTPERLASSLSEETIIFGEGWASLERDIRAALPTAVSLSHAPERAVVPSAIQIAHLGLIRFQQSEIAGDVITPLYVQRAEAEVQYEQSGGLSPVERRRKRVEQKVAERLARGSQRGTKRIR